MKTIFRSTADIIAHIRGKFPHMIIMGAGYSKADLITDLEAIERDTNERIERLTERVETLEEGGNQLPMERMSEIFMGTRKK